MKLDSGAQHTWWQEILSAPHSGQDIQCYVTYIQAPQSHPSADVTLSIDGNELR